MNKNLFGRIRLTPLLIVFAGLVNVQEVSSQQTFCTNSEKTQYTGVEEGFRYELWNQNGQGTGCMTLGAGALFKGNWDGVLNYLARRGLEYNETQTHDQIGTFYADYDCDYRPTTESGNSYLSIYGWTVDPLIEFYIVEDWRNWIPSMANGVSSKGTLSVDGGIYDIYVSTRVNQPSIQGNTTFKQYFSIRRSTRNSGKISISEHFKKWESLGLEMGKMYEVSFVVEGYQSKGNFEFKSLNVYSENVPVSTQNISVSPLPVSVEAGSGVVSIKIQEPSYNASVKVLDAFGRTQFSGRYVENTPLIITNLNRGLYLLNVKSSQYNYNSKFFFSQNIL